MSDGSVQVNQPTSSGALIAGFVSADSRFHQEVVLQMQDSTGDPISIGFSNPLPVQGNVAAAVADAGNGVKISAVYHIAPPTYADGQRVDLVTNAQGALNVNIVAGGGTGGTASAFGSAFPTQGTPVGALNAAGTLFVPFNLDGGGNLKVNISAGSVQAVADNASVFAAGTTQALAFAGAYNDVAGAVTVGNMAIARISQNRQLRVVVDQDPTSIGALTTFSALSTASTNATLVKSAPGRICTLVVGNTNAAARYIKLYNSATIPTPGSGTPVKRLMVPGNTAGAGFAIPIPACGWGFPSGIGFTITGAAADADTTAISANEVTINIGYA